MGYRVAVVGATGNVGREMLQILAERNFPADDVVAFGLQAGGAGAYFKTGWAVNVDDGSASLTSGCFEGRFSPT